MNEVYQVEAAHFSIPGRIVRLHQTEAGATQSAVELTQMIWDDHAEAIGTSEQLTVTTGDWEEFVKELQDCHGEDLVGVVLTKHKVLL